MKAYQIVFDLAYILGIVEIVENGVWSWCTWLPDVPYYEMDWADAIRSENFSKKRV